jgi:hypothetical protein
MPEVVHEGPLTEQMRARLLQKHILEAIGSKPTGILGINLWNRIRKHVYGFTVVEFEDSLRTMRDFRIIVCTNKRWWLTDYTKNNWAEVNEKDYVHCA